MYKIGNNKVIPDFLSGLLIPLNCPRRMKKKIKAEIIIDTVEFIVLNTPLKDFIILLSSLTESIKSESSHWFEVTNVIFV